MGGDRGRTSQEDHRVGLAQLGVELALPVAPGGDALLGVEVEEQRDEALGLQPLLEALGGVLVATAVRNEQRGQLFLAPLLKGSCPSQGAAKKKVGLAPLSS